MPLSAPRTLRSVIADTEWVLETVDTAVRLARLPLRRSLGGLHLGVAAAHPLEVRDDDEHEEHAAGERERRVHAPAIDGHRDSSVAGIIASRSVSVPSESVVARSRAGLRREM